MKQSEVLRAAPGINDRYSTDVTVRLKSVMPMLVQAVEQRRSWICDFADEEISLSRDLYEVIQAAMLYAPETESAARKTTASFLAGGSTAPPG